MTSKNVWAEVEIERRRVAELRADLGATLTRLMEANQQVKALRAELQKARADYDPGDE